MFEKTQTHNVTQSEWTTSLIHNAEGTTAFVDAKELELKTAIELSKAVGEVKLVSKKQYDTNIYMHMKRIMLLT